MSEAKDLPRIPDWIARLLPAGLRRRRVDVGGVAMHVMEAGEGRPVVMVHGNPTWGFLYRKVVTELPGDRFRVILPDLVGLGFSDKPRAAEEHQLDAHGRWLGTLLDALGLERPIVVLHDWGGPIGLRALADRPGLAGALVLLNTVVGPPRSGFRASRFHRLARIPVVSDVLFRGLGFPLRSLHKVQGDPRSISGDVARAYRFPLRGLTSNVAPLALARMVPDQPTHPSMEPLARCQAFFESFTGPVAVVWGERDPILGRVLPWIEKLKPQARVTRTQAGHFLQEEEPEAIAAAIKAVTSS